MSNRLDIGIASYGTDVDKLSRTCDTLRACTQSDWRCFIIHNPSENDSLVQEFIRVVAERDVRFIPIWMQENEGYAGAVNELMRRAETEHIAYCDNDVEILTPGWDVKLRALLDNPEVAQSFPGPGHYGFHNGRYHECLWNAGYCWIIKRAALNKLIESDALHYRRGGIPGPIDTTLGHHEEVDLMIRLRLAGFQIACAPDVEVKHHESSTRSEASAQRIHDGVVRWMNKWNRYFCGDQLEYSMTKYDDRALRYTDWPPCALYLERMTLNRFPNWNADPRAVRVPGVGNMDAVEVLKPTGCYKGRAI
jgi:GT2 family glycosyltransferase